MNKQNKAAMLRERLAQARAFKQSAIPAFRQLVESARQSYGEIELYYNLTPYGRVKQKERAVKEYETKALQLAHKLKTDYKRMLQDIRREAEEVLFAPIEQPDERQRRLYDMQAKELEHAVLFAVNAKQAQEALGKLVELAKSHPAFAQELQRKLFPLSRHILTLPLQGEQPLSVMQKMAAFNEELSQSAYTADQLAAKEALDVVNANLEAPMFPPSVTDAVTREISKTAARYLETPEEILGTEADVQDNGENRENGENGSGANGPDGLPENGLHAGATANESAE